MERPKPAADRRKADLAQIHIAKKDLGLDDDAYRDVLYSVAKVKSSRDLDFMGRQSLLQWFRSKGWKPRQATDKPGKPGKARPAAAGSHQSKALALWLELRRAGKIEPTAGDAELDAYCKRMTGVDRREWMTAAQANVVIEGLKAWLSR